MDEKKELAITCTPLAVEKAKEHIAKRNKAETKGIRIGLRGGGCNGFSIIMEFVDNFNDRDHIFKFDDVSIYVDPKSLVYLNGTVIDYEFGLMGKGFKFRIPGQKGTCGCGASIAF
jgi:iron-sulfur cluster assembly protein